MKKIIFLLKLVSFLILFNNNILFCQWSFISAQGNAKVLFTSVNTGYSTPGPFNYVSIDFKKTTNGGYNWSTVSTNRPFGLFFLNDLTGWIMGNNGYIGKTTNGGLNLSQQDSVTQYTLLDAYFINENTGWIVGGYLPYDQKEIILNTTNGGTNWIIQLSEFGHMLHSVYFIDDNTGWCVGYSDRMWKTTNSGNSWLLLNPTFTYYYLYSIMFADEYTGWAVGGDATSEMIIKTTNAGGNWSLQSSGDNKFLYECFVKNTQEVIAVGKNGKMINTTNGGLNWNFVSVGYNEALFSVNFANDSVGYTVGEFAVFKTTNGGLTFIQSNNNNITNEYILFQNYPNPFNSATNIKFAVPVNSFVKLKIYDILGKEILTLVDERLKQGIYEVKFDSGDLPGGIYFYRLTVDNVPVSAKKMVIQK